MREVSNTTWWIGYVITLVSFGLLTSIGLDRLDLNRWIDAGLIVAGAIAIWAVYQKLLVIKHDD